MRTWRLSRAGRRPAASRRHRTGAASGSAAPPWGSCPRAVSVRSSDANTVGLPDLGHRHHVQRVVEPPVPDAGEPMPDLAVRTGTCRRPGRASLRQGPGRRQPAPCAVIALAPRPTSDPHPVHRARRGRHGGPHRHGERDVGRGEDEAVLNRVVADLPVARIPSDGTPYMTA